MLNDLVCNPKAAHPIYCTGWIVYDIILHLHTVRMVAQLNCPVYRHNMGREYKDTSVQNKTMQVYYIHTVL